MTRARDLAAFVSNADGDIKFDTDTLFIDSSTNRVGLGTNAPSVQLDIESTDPTIRLTDSDATGTPESEVSGAGGDVTIRADRDNEKSDSLISFEVDGSPRMTINHNGYIGINDTTPSYPLEVNGTVRAVGTNNLPALIVDGNSSNEGDICAATGQHISFGHHGLTGAAGQFTERWRISSDGHFKAATDGLGIDFSASEGSNASSSILHDYEEGSWTAQVSVGGSNVTTTNTDSTYVKIGRQVFLHGNIAFSVGTGTGDVNITGLPYSPAFSGYFRGIMANDFFDESGEFYTIVSTTGPKILPRVGPTGQADGSRTLNGNDIKDNISARIYIGLIYQV